MNGGEGDRFGFYYISKGGDGNRPIEATSAVLNDFCYQRRRHDFAG